MAYCGPKGIPLSTFLSWLEEDQQAALAWQAHEARRCPQCGTHPEDYRNDGRGPNDVHFHGRTCQGCRDADRARSNLGDALERPGVSVVSAHGSARECRICNPRLTEEAR